jgi:hypothetical protein
MPVVQYSRQVQPNQPSGYRQPVVAGPESFGAEVGQALSNAGKVVGDIALKQQERDDAKAVLDASEAYKKDMITAFNGEQGFFALKGDNAANVAQQAADFMTKTRTKYEGGLNSRQLQAFRSHVLPTENAYYQGSLTHQQQEKDAAFTNTINSGIETDTQMIIANYKNTDLMNVPLGSIDKKVASFGAVKGWDSATVKQKQLEYKSKAVSNAFEYAMNIDDIDRAKSLIGDFREVIDKNILGKMESVVRQKTEKIVVKSEAQRLLDVSGGNLEAALEAAKNSTSTIGGSFESGFSNFTNSLLPIESGGRYDAKGPWITYDDGTQDRAYGKYQIMGNNWPSWAQEAGLSRDAEMTPANQDKVYKYKIQQYYNQFGGDWGKVAIAWHAGPGRANLPDAELAKLSDGNMTTLEYKNSINASMGASSGPLSNAEHVQKLQEAIRQEYATREVIHNQRVKQQMDKFDEYLITYKPTSIDQIEQAARQFGFTGSDLLGAIGKGKQVAGLVKFEQTQATEEYFESALREIHDGKITNEQMLDVKYGDKIPISKLMMLENSLKREMKWATSENIAMLNGVVTELKLTSEDKARIMEKINLQAQVNASKGMPALTQSDIEQIAREQGQTIIINGGFLGIGKTKVRLDEVPPGWNVSSDGTVTDPNGIKMDYDKNTHQWFVKGS